MPPFTYQAATTLGDALTRLAEPGAVPIAGATDLLVCIEEGIAAPSTVVDVRRVEESQGIERAPAGTLRIGAAASLADVARDEVVRREWPMLAEACEASATPALREMATIGGNLLQRPRCWYFRRDVGPCFKRGGDGCAARDGENRYHAIIEGGPCWMVHPSDPAVALVALDAAVELASPRAVRRVPAAEFFVSPRERLDQETVKDDDELITAVLLPRESAGGWQRYTKLGQREAWDFALASLAAVRRTDGEVRLVLGGIAPRPYRVYNSVEEEAATDGLDEDTIAGLAERALLDAVPLSDNAYKVAMAESLIRDAIREISSL